MKDYIYVTQFRRLQKLKIFKSIRGGGIHVFTNSCSPRWWRDSHPRVMGVVAWGGDRCGLLVVDTHSLGEEDTTRAVGPHHVVLGNGMNSKAHGGRQLTIKRKVGS